MRSGRSWPWMAPGERSAVPTKILLSSPHSGPAAVAESATFAIGAVKTGGSSDSRERPTTLAWPRLRRVAVDMVAKGEGRLILPCAFFDWFESRRCCSVQSPQREKRGGRRIVAAVARFLRNRRRRRRTIFAQREKQPPPHLLKLRISGPSERAIPIPDLPPFPTPP